jgi:hypothetical protein
MDCIVPGCGPSALDRAAKRRHLRVRATQDAHSQTQQHADSTIFSQTQIHQRRAARHPNKQAVIALIEEERQQFISAPISGREIYLAFRKRSTIWQDADIDMNAHILKHLQPSGAPAVQAYDPDSPYITLLKPASYPNPWYRAGAASKKLDISVADSAIKAVFVDGLKMTVNQVSIGILNQPGEGADG